MDGKTEKSHSGTSRIEGGETARRALRLIEAVLSVHEPVGLDDLAKMVNLSKSTCYRLVRVLQEELYLDRAESGGYRVGSRLVGVAAAVLSQAPLYQSARPALRALAEAAGETATLHVRSGNRGVLVLGVESTGQVLRRAATVGETTWLGQGSSGLAILAHLAAADADPVIAQAEDPAALRETLAEVRRDGYKMSFGANHPGVHGIAAPVPSAGMSVAVSGPAERWTEERMRAFSGRLLNACAELSVLFDDSSARPRGY